MRRVNFLVGASEPFAHGLQQHCARGYINGY